jgi:ABC-2 type transport system permease protein
LNALVTGLAVLAAMTPFVALPQSLPPSQPLLALPFALAGAALFGLAGVLIGLWADKWDHYSAAESFLILPLGVLSGAFFPLEGLPDVAQTLILFAPGASLAILLIVDLVLAWLAWRLIDRGYKIKP